MRGLGFGTIALLGAMPLLFPQAGRSQDDVTASGTNCTFQRDPEGFLNQQARLRREIPTSPTRIIGASRQMKDVLKLLGKAARSNSTVLITGESGTGKELFARSIHDMSERKGSFVPVNCAAIPTELIESELFGHTGQAFTGAKQARTGLFCLLYTSPSPRDRTRSRMPSSA